ncbi:IBR domain-containing protein [Drepanopeziza brunnea f. sp. 'multigermtubi' MB_m1]|uniref:RBR-type E3 ubiquitin transferase n=1 Tax=Marssonina brunnea f. sp. multigermtubi (strain MB_m1) TaxID=1072389 RepID=K1WGT5_MARBU|nr:IBR domain-containing protein [Drepanopeziza brunnea f. sp. 'multigermtubi' MB_m1]EKD16785.1 IBR domain-containing protein [Drepanopeziza brunnea f. sp. 'multigermtubi' MB_m1]
MSPVLRKRSLADMQEGKRTSLQQPAVLDDQDYVREVLQLEGQTEALLDQHLLEEAESLGIAVPIPIPIPISTTPADGHYATPDSRCESANTTPSHHRTASSGSHGIGWFDTSNAAAAAGKETDICEEEPVVLRVREVPGTAARGARAPEAVPACTFRPSPLALVGTDAKIIGQYQEWVQEPVWVAEDETYAVGSQFLPTGDESKMPPRCCTQAIPSAVIKSVLTTEQQQLFMKSVLQFSTPWESRVFCSNTACGEFIPKRSKIDSKHPFEVSCRECRTRACSICRGAAHAFGQDCPADWELDAVLQMGEKSGWRRCYKCRNLVELTQGCSHITCRCKAQFCYICGAVWDPTVGCPNYCSGEEELERRRLEEEARVAEEEAEKAAKEEAEKVEAAERAEAEKRTSESVELKDLRARQINERDRFTAFERKMKWMLWARHGQGKIDILERYDELRKKTGERHIRTAAHLEDRQVAAEMELRASLKQQERSVRIRLRHMEAYCDGLGQNTNGPNPARVVTERDLRELGQQYNIWNDLERLHQSKINVMRDKQAKQMEDLLRRQEEEIERLGRKQDEEMEALDEKLVNEEEVSVGILEARRQRLQRRWLLVEEVERQRLELEKNVRFAPLPPVTWPHLETKDEEVGLEAVAE